MTNDTDYLKTSEKVSKTLQNGGTDYFSGSSLGDTVALGTAYGTKKVNMDVLREATNPGDERTIGGLTGFDTALLSINPYRNKNESSYAKKMLPQPMGPDPFDRKRKPIDDWAG